MRWQRFLSIGLVLAVVIIGCSPRAAEIVATATTTPVVTPTAAGATATPSSGEAPSPATPDPAAVTSATPTTLVTATMIPRPLATVEVEGILTGHASIGPLTPVERIGVATPTPGPLVCTSRGLAIYAADGTSLVTSFSFQPDCSYRVALPPGTYVVKLREAQRGIGGSKSLPRTVSIGSGQTVVLDIDIDTGIR